MSDALEHGTLTTRHRLERLLDADDGTAVADAGFDATAATPFPATRVARLPMRLPVGQAVFGLQIRASADLAVGSHGTIDLILRDENGRAVGGLAIDLLIDA